MENAKHAFWQAFFLTMLFFLVGLVLGVYLEQIRSDNFSIAFYDSEVSLYDSFALGKLLDSNITSCDALKKTTLDFADKIYNEAIELERFDEKNRLTDSMKSVHRKYDLLRTLLWMNAIGMKEKCGQINTIVYIYVYDTQHIEVRARQIVWARILRDFKEKEGDDVLLIPIASDQKIGTLDYLADFYNVKQFPAVIINEEDVFYEQKSVDELMNYLK